MKLKLMIIGYARHGKDTLCDILRENYGYTFESSSYACLHEVVYPILKDKYGYTTPEECYEDRVNHRSEWYDLIAAYNTPDKAKLGRLIYSKFDIYCGLRNREEFLALRSEGAFDVSIWVDASKRLPPEPESSNTILRSDADYILYNNSTLEDFKETISDLFKFLEIPKV